MARTNAGGSDGDPDLCAFLLDVFPDGEYFRRFVWMLDFTATDLLLERPASKKRLIEDAVRVLGALGRFDAAFFAALRAEVPLRVAEVDRLAVVPRRPPRVDRLAAVPRQPSRVESGLDPILRGYLGQRIAEWCEDNAAARYLRPRGRAVDAPRRGDYVLSEAMRLHRQIRSAMRLLIPGREDPGQPESAPFPAPSQRSRPVADVAALLESNREPLVLLGDPGMGKSFTLREVAIRLARRNLALAQPRLVVYLRLGQYVDAVGDEPGDVLEFVRDTVARSEPELAVQLDALLAAGRAALLFDGMDEMEGPLHGKRVAALRGFADRHRERVQMLFACRINDFSPSFGRQTVLLAPFSREQMRQYVLSALPESLQIGPDVWKRKQIADLLLAADELEELLQTPMLLHLACDMIEHRHQLPRSRADLFASFVSDGARARVAKTRTARTGALVEVTTDEASAWREVWGALAFGILQATGGIYAKEAGLASFAGDAAIAAGIDAGVLTRDPIENGGLRFTHRHLQEYLAATHLVRADAPVTWRALFDAPRWGEVLVHLTELGGGRDACEVLFASLGAVGRRIGDPTREQRGANRIGLAAKIVAFADRIVLPHNAVPRLAAAATCLASRGNPSTQVRVIQALRHLPSAPLHEFLAVPLASPVLWVREHALFALAHAGPSHWRGRADLALDMGLHVIDGDFLAHVPMYGRVVRAAGRARLYWLLAYTCVLGLAGAAIIIAALLAAWSLGRGVPDNAATLTPWPPLLALAVIGAVFGGYFWWDVGRHLTLSLACGAVFFATFWGCVLGLRPMSDLWWLLWESLAVFTAAAVLPLLLAPFIAGGGWLVAAVRPRGLHTAAWRIVKRNELWIGVFLPLALIVGYWLVAWAADAIQHAPPAVRLAAALVVIAGLLALASTRLRLPVPSVLILAYMFPRLRYAIGLFFGLALGIAAGSGIRWMRSHRHRGAALRRLLPTLDLKRWGLLIERVDEAERTRMLEWLRHGRYGATPAEVVEALHDLANSDVFTNGTANSTYWKILDEMKALARQACPARTVLRAPSRRGLRDFGGRIEKTRR